jgi:hypothetical protein
MSLKSPFNEDLYFCADTQTVFRFEARISRRRCFFGNLRRRTKVSHQKVRASGWDRSVLNQTLLRPKRKALQPKRKALQPKRRASLRSLKGDV